MFSILAGIGVSIACALVLSVVTLRLRGLYLALATLAFGLLINSCAVGFLDITGGPSGLVGIPSFSVAGFTFASPRAMYYLVLALDVIILVGLVGAMRSGFGRALKAIRSDQMAAAALGVNVVRYKLAAFLISVTLASLAGSLYAFFFNFLSPEMVGTSRSLELVAMLIIGGESTLVGGLFGALLLTLLPVIFAPLAIYKTFASGALLVRSFLHLPQGLYGALMQVLARLGGSRDTALAKAGATSKQVRRHDRDRSAGADKRGRDPERAWPCQKLWRPESHQRRVVRGAAHEVDRDDRPEWRGKNHRLQSRSPTSCPAMRGR